LLISAVNIDTAQNRVFNIGEIANAVAPMQARRDCIVEAMLARRTGREIRVNATIVVNGALAPFEQPATDTLPGYLTRSAEILADEVLRDSITEAISFAESRADAASGTFDACVTEILFDHGRSVASTAPIAWKNADALRDKANEF